MATDVGSEKILHGTYERDRNEISLTLNGGREVSWSPTSEFEATTQEEELCVTLKLVMRLERDVRNGGVEGSLQYVNDTGSSPVIHLKGLTPKGCEAYKACVCGAPDQWKTERAPAGLAVRDRNFRELVQFVSMIDGRSSSAAGASDLRKR